MQIIKYIHVTCAILTAFSFTIRCIWMLQGSRLLDIRATRIVPHIIDAVLLFSGILLLINYYRDFYHYDWLLLKLMAIILYIISGSVALKYGRTLTVRFAAMLVSFGLLAAIIILAVMRPVSLF